MNTRQKLILIISIAILTNLGYSQKPSTAYRYLEIDNIVAAREAIETALGLVQAPMDQFLAFSEAMIQARERLNTSLFRTTCVAVTRALPKRISRRYVPPDTTGRSNR